MKFFQILLLFTVVFLTVGCTQQDASVNPEQDNLPEVAPSVLDSAPDPEPEPVQPTEPEETTTVDPPVEENTPISEDAPTEQTDEDVLNASGEDFSDEFDESFAELDLVKSLD
jgi:type IV secretory pathway VirB10-like protein